jgi:hypothetical protein
MDLETLVVVGAVFKDGKRGFYCSRHGACISAHGELRLLFEALARPEAEASPGAILRRSGAPTSGA